MQGIIKVKKFLNKRYFYIFVEIQIIYQIKQNQVEWEKQKRKLQV